MINLFNPKRRSWRTSLNKEIIIVTIINLLIGIIALITKNKNIKFAFSFSNYMFFICLMYFPVASFLKHFRGKSKYVHILPLSKMQIFLMDIRNYFCLTIIYIFSNLMIRFFLLEKSVKYILDNINVVNMIPVVIYYLIAFFILVSLIISLGIIFKLYKTYWTVGVVVFLAISNFILNVSFSKTLMTFKFWTNLKLEDLVLLGEVVNMQTTYIQKVIPVSYFLTTIIQGMIIIFAFSKLNKISIE